MPTFTYTAIDTAGATVEGSTKADTVGATRAWLHENNLYAISINERHRKLLDFELTAAKLPKRELMHFSRQLAVFVKAGIPIIDSLQTIAEEAGDKVLRRVIDDIVDQLRAGSTFTAAAAAHPEAFPRFYIGVLRSAELTGHLDETLDKLADYLDREIETRGKVVAALTYPSVVAALAVVTVVILAGFVLPKFTPLFAELGTDLPLPTRMLLGVTRLFTDLWFIPAGIVAVIAVFAAWLLKSERGRRTRDRLLLKLPAVGGIVRYAILERFCRILATMTSAGVPLPEAMEVTTESTNNVVFKEGLEQARAAMVSGAGLARPLIATGLFPGAARQMFTVGEETGTLDEQLETAAIYFDRELEMRIRRFVGYFEPAMIIFVGLIVGFVAVALVSAMYGVLDGYQDVPT